jgi:predicted transcriptional regulator
MILKLMFLSKHSDLQKKILGEIVFDDDFGKTL